MKYSFLNQFGIKVSKEEIKLAESGEKVKKWVQVFRLGHWKHPRFGPLSFTKDIFDGFIKSFNDNVRRIDLAIDQEHKPEKGAAGWIKKLENRGEEGFWALVEWTEHGLKLLKDKTFRYLSGDFDYEWKDEETGKKFKNVMFGAALTNRPFIKGMSPINLSEFKDEIKTIEHCRNAFRLMEDVLKLQEENKVTKTDEEIMKAKDEELTEEEKARKAKLVKDKALEEDKKKDEKTEEEKKKELEEDEEKKKKEEKELADIESNPDPSTDKTKAKKDDIKGQKELEDEEDKDKKKEEEKKELEDKEEDKEKKDDKKKNNSIALLKVRAKAVGLGEDATEDDIVKEEKKKEKIDQKGISKSLQEKTDDEIMKTPDDELSEAEMARKKELLKKDVNLSDVAGMEIRLSEMEKSLGEDDLTVKLLREHIKTKKDLHETRIEAAKDKVKGMLEKAWLAGKLSIASREKWEAILCGEIENGSRTIKLSELDEEGGEQEVTKTLSEIIEADLDDRTPIVELAEKALAEKAVIDGNPDPAEEAEENQELGKKIANSVTKGTKSNEQKAEEKKADINPKKNE